MTSSERSSATERTASHLDRAALPGADLLVGAMDNHVHACPHINARSIDVLQAVDMAAKAGMKAIGLMDNFANSSGLAALANRQMGHLGVEVFGGLIMEPSAGGIRADIVRTSLMLGYGDPRDGARFVSLPTHHTRHTATQEGRAPDYVAGCLHIPDRGPLPDPLPEILDLIAGADVVLNAGHLTGPEALRLTEKACDAGLKRILVPSNHFDTTTVAQLCAAGAHVEFSFFLVSHATQSGLTHVDNERHAVPPVTGPQVATLIAAADPARVVLSSDCGVFLLPTPPEGLRQFLLLLEACGVAREDLRHMVSDTPINLFRVTG